MGQVLEKLDDFYTDLKSGYGYGQYSKQLAWPLVLLLNSLQVIVHFSRLYNEYEKFQIEELFSPYKNGFGSTIKNYKSAKHLDYNSIDDIEHSSFYKLAINAISLFSKKKKYQIRGTPKEEWSSMSNIKRVPDTSTRIYNEPKKQKNSFFLNPNVENSDTNYMYELFIWDPSEFSLNLFCWWSPVQLILICFSDTNNWYYLVPAIFAVGFQMQYVVTEFVNLERSKKILVEQVYNEYNEGFVYPRLFKRSREIAILTDINSMNNPEYFEDSENKEKYISKNNFELKEHINTNINQQQESFGNNITPLKKIKEQKRNDRTPYKRSILLPQNNLDQESNQKTKPKHTFMFSPLD
ncbi:hypothetical protein BB559_001237 [Furculomyces boomerangus]|uniref:Uncharacterized protein n=2 Tax=Harpellales TaxID=61421 RepID=A0A2T9Z2Q4_9FUNG|nr:hypothetical protein BB559_001237 [Furculomyces boomerangus]PWA00675.1 hypothetical protein BB558_003271 [Smittium angustum]